MKLIYAIELLMAALVSITGMCLLKNKRARKARILLSTLIFDILFIGHVTFAYTTEKPILQLNGEKNIQIEIGEEYRELGAKATYHGKDLMNQIQIENQINSGKIGEYDVIYKISYHNTTEEIVRKVKIMDRTKPEIHLKGGTEVTQYMNKEYIEPGYEAIDNYDGDITSKVVVTKEEINPEEYKLHYFVKDSSENEERIARIIRLKEPPKESGKMNQKNGQSILSLTFDDGPSLDITPKILDILKQENVKATFFILNYDKNKEFLVKRIVEEGHTVAIHGYSHNYKEIYQSVDTYLENLNKLQKKIKETTGVTTTLSRFPGGSSNTVSRYNPGIMTKLTKTVIEKGYQYFDWNVSSGDAGGAKTKKEVYQNVISGLKKNRNNVVLMHDFAKNKKTLEALPSIIQYGKTNGYQFEKLTENTPMIVQRINN